MEDIVQKIIETLSIIRLRPKMYFRNVGELKAMLAGFNMACGLFGYPSGFDDAYRQAVVERGWKWLPAAGVLPALIENGLDDDSIVEELLTIEIEAWKKRYSN
ncbi:MAG: hypothetical protein F9K27_14595 [Anaerolineae bacterium]|nr:MAG: hypothetical protein F9K27_14595 [Anaerolineae bacterium]